MRIKYNKIQNYKYFVDNVEYFYEIGVPQDWQAPYREGKSIICKEPRLRIIINFTNVITWEKLLSDILKDNPEYIDRVTYNELGSWRDNIQVRQITEEFYKDGILGRSYFLAMNYADKILYLLTTSIAAQFQEEEQKTLRAMGTFSIDTKKLDSAYSGTPASADSGLYLVQVLVTNTKEGQSYNIEIYGPNGEYLASGSVSGIMIGPYPYVVPILSHKIPVGSTYKVCVKKTNSSAKNCTNHTRYSGYDYATAGAPFY